MVIDAAVESETTASAVITVTLVSYGRNDDTVGAGEPDVGAVPGVTESSVDPPHPASASDATIAAAVSRWVRVMVVAFLGITWRGF